MYILLTPVNYLKIRSDHKIKLDWLWPIISVVFYILLLFTSFPLKLMGKYGLIASITELLKILIGFYIASLCAIATFHSRVLDHEMYGPVKLTIYEEGKPTEKKLSRRRYLSYMFGYLAFLSIFIYFLGVASPWMAKALVSLLNKCTNDATVSHNIYIVFKHTFACVFLGLSMQLISLTLVGLHYLCDRMHRNP